MSIVPRVLLLIVFLELVERLQVLQAQRAQEALLHLPCALEGGHVAGGHVDGVGWVQGGSSDTHGVPLSHATPNWV